MLSITTDYARSTGDPSPHLRRIADAGFTHIHWCHQWNTDFVYAPCEVAQIERWLREYGLQLLDLHGSVGPEKNWASAREYERLAGVELVRNRIDLTAQLGGRVVIMHIPAVPGSAPLRQSLDELERHARQRHLRLALENGSFDAIGPVLAAYSPDYLGLCYDCGHGNLDPTGLTRLAALKERLISVHLHDNDGAGDQHKLLFTGTVDWPRLAGIMAQSAYTGCVSMESTLGQTGITEEPVFLARAFEAGTRFAAMIAAAR